MENGPIASLMCQKPLRTVITGIRCFKTKIFILFIHEGELISNWICLQICHAKLTRDFTQTTNEQAGATRNKLNHISNMKKKYTWWTNLDKQFNWAAPVLQQTLGHGWTSQLLMLLNQSPDQIHVWPGHWLKVHDLLVAKRWKVILPVCVEVK